MTDLLGFNETRFSSSSEASETELLSIHTSSRSLSGDGDGVESRSVSGDDEDSEGEGEGEVEIAVVEDTPVKEAANHYISLDDHRDSAARGRAAPRSMSFHNRVHSSLNPGIHTVNGPQSNVVLKWLQKSWLFGSELSESDEEGGGAAGDNIWETSELVTGSHDDVLHLGDEHTFRDNGRTTLERVQELWRKMVWLRMWLLLSLLAIVSVFSAVIIDILSTYLIAALLHTRTVTPYVPINLLLWCLASVSLAAGSTFIVLNFTPKAMGTGVPEMKSILSGVECGNFLSLRTALGKFVSLVLAVGSGLSIGREGPFIHLSSIYAFLITKIPLFRTFGKNKALLQQVLATGCAVGVATAFGAPFGGVLFSVEVTASYYWVENLWKGVFCAGVAHLFLSSIGTANLDALFDPLNSNFQLHVMTDLREMLGYVFIGIEAGVLGALFVRLIEMVARMDKLWQWGQTRNGRLVKVSVVALLTALLSFWSAPPFLLLRSDTAQSIDYMLQESDETTDPIVLVGLFFFKITLTALAINFSSTAFGIYTPIFLAGAALGRFWGHVATYLLPAWELDTVSYALVGAAALAAGVTRTLSTVVIVVELTRQIRLLMPILIAVLVAVGVGQLISLSIYDAMLRLKGLPFISASKLQKEAHRVTANDVMNQDYAALSLTSTTVRDVIRALVHSSSSHFPVVEDKENMEFVGAVRRGAIRRAAAQLLFSDSSHSPDQQLGHLLSSLNKSVETLESRVRSVDVSVSALDQRLLFAFSSQRNTATRSIVRVDATSMCVSPQTTMHQVRSLFTMLGFERVFVTSRGRLVGEVTEREMLTALRGTTSTSSLAPLFSSSLDD